LLINKAEIYCKIGVDLQNPDELKKFYKYFKLESWKTFDMVAETMLRQCCSDLAKQILTIVILEGENVTPFETFFHQVQNIELSITYNRNAGKADKIKAYYDNLKKKILAENLTYIEF